MKQIIQMRYLFLVLILISLSVIANGQSKGLPASSEESADDYRPTVEESERLLNNDRRLRIRLSFKRTRTTVDKAVRALSQSSGIKLTVDDPNIGAGELSCQFRETPLRDILDSIAELYRGVWKRKAKGVLALVYAYSPYQYDIHRPHSEAEAQLYRTGRQLIAEIAKLPPQTQEALKDRNTNGLEYSQLPSEMRSLMRDFVAAKIQAFGEQSRYASRINPDNLTGATFRMGEARQQENIVFHEFSFKAERESHNFSIPVFLDPRDQNDRVVPLVSHGEYSDTFRPDATRESDDADSRQQALEKEPRLKTRVTLTMPEVTLSEVLQQVAPHIPFNFVVAVCWDKKKAIKQSFKSTLLPLGEVFDRLVAERQYSWGQRASGIFVFHYIPKPGKIQIKQMKPEAGRLVSP